ncbi:polymorphic toxin-type HINT domain-containing protein [Micromonospora humida]|uniref:polymorphic toxin-type HINT domain-containing protein n=1 Tax=Micromonospora humida TaxID=2809018 RepID=UPI00342BDA51
MAGSACSFSADTQVLMADGSVMPIKDIKVGDRVTAADPQAGEKGSRPVTNLWIHEDKLSVLLVDGNVLSTTEDHPFWNVTDQKWERADELDPGDLLATLAGGSVAVNGLVPGTTWADAAYILTVNGIHTYYVVAGDVPVLVHNTGVGTCSVSGLPHGAMGETATQWRMLADGFTNIASQVRFRNSNGDVFIADFVGKDGRGNWVAVEAKTGRGATISPAQQVGYPELESGGVILDTSKLAVHGIPKGSRVTMGVQYDVWTCPICGS